MSQLSAPDPFAGRLLRGERILWSGQPRQGLMLTANDAFLIPFGLLWGGFAIFWETSVLRMPNAPLFMALFGIPFVLVGLFVIFGRFVMDAWIRVGVFYALTDRRILILRTRPSANFQSLNLDRLADATLKEGANGFGSIRFGPPAPMWGSRAGGFGSWMAALDPTPQFLAIANVRRVFALIEERQQRDA